MNASRLLAACLLLLLTGAAVLQLPTGSQAAYVNPSGLLIEDFENATFPAQPESAYYTLTRSGVGIMQISTTAAETGSRAYRVDGTDLSNAAVAAFDLGMDLCQADPLGPGGRRYVDFSIRFTADTGGGGNYLSVGLENAAGTQFVKFQRVTGGTVSHLGTMQTATGSGSISMFLGDQNGGPDTDWYRHGISCDAATATASFCYYDSVTMGGSACTSLDVTGSLVGITRFVIRSSSNDVSIDRINFGSPPAITETSPEGPSIAVTGLSALDVSRDGTTLIARTNDGPDNEQLVRTYPAGSLAAPGQSTDTDCNRIGGVAAMPSYVAYFDCDEDDPNKVDHLKIRDLALGDPAFPTYCSEGIDFCDKDISADELAGCQGSDDGSPDSCTVNSRQYDIVSVTEVPFDYTAGCDGDGNFFNGGEESSLHGEDCGTRDAVYMAFGATFENGYVGVITYTMNRGGDDKSQITRTQLGPSGTVVNQMCVVQDPDGQTYLYATQSSATARGYRLDFELEAGSSITMSTLAVSMTSVFPGTAQTTNAVGVACGNQRFATIQSNGVVCVFARNAASPLFPCRAVGTVQSAALAMSGDGNFVSWVEGTSVRTMCAIVAGCPATANRGAVAVGGLVAQSTIPSETVVAMELDGNANSLWLGTTVKIRNYNALFQLTTGNATACLPGDVNCGAGRVTTTPTTAPNGLGGTDGGLAKSYCLGCDPTMLMAFGTMGLVVLAVAGIVVVMRK